ncbi:MAG: hypothetical protein K2L02_03410 [Clostridia bacterium]|nr:hypothetical protein [Clostridia bacterium]
MENPVKTYKFRFTPMMIAVFSLGIALCAACFAITTWQFSEFVNGLRGNISSAWEWIKYLLLYFVSIFLAVLLIAMLIRSHYILTEKRLITQFGIIFSKYEIKKIRSVCLLNGTKKLNVYFDDFKNRFITIVVKEEWYDDFIRTLTSINEKIEFDFTSPENKEIKK